MKILYTLISLLIIVLILINISIFVKKNKLHTIQKDYSFVIGKDIVYSDSLKNAMNIQNNYILCIINPTCEDCYIKINRWNEIVSKEKKLRNGNVIFLVVENEFERLNELIKDKQNLKFIFDYKNEFFKNNKYFTQSQTYLVNKWHKVILCGDPLHSKMVMKLFLDEIN